METGRRNIQDGKAYAHLFPAAQSNTQTIKRFADVNDTVAFIPKVVADTLEQTKQIAALLQGVNIYATCKNIWHFVYEHINYKKDKEGFEQIRSPARTWHDRAHGVDCDCYSVFISSILTNLHIAHTLRITKYHRNYFQHIYPIVPYGKTHITMDCVTDQFNYEVPYSAKQDYPMDLQFLNGIDGAALYQNNNELYLLGVEDDLEGLGKLFKKKAAKTGAPKTNFLATIKNKAVAAKAKAAASPPAAPAKKKGIFKKVLNVVNKVNPATVLLRNGLLAAMKLNVKNVAQRLRWSYLSEAQAAAKGIDIAKHKKLVATRQKLENIFHGAGGKVDNLKKAILSGKGNRDKSVQGFGFLPMGDVDQISINTPLNQLLGDDIYASENIEGMSGFQGFGQLGEPVTLATVGAAMGVISGIVAALKSIGDIFKNKQPGSEDFDEAKTDAPENNVPAAASAAATSAMVSTNASFPATASSSYASEDNDASDQYRYASPAAANAQSATVQEDNSLVYSEGSAENATDQLTFWNKHKKWLKPVAIGVGGLTLIAVGVKLLKSKKPHHYGSRSSQLSGLPRKKKKKYHSRKKYARKTAIALI